MNYRRQPFQFTAIDPAKRHAELQKRFGLPANEMYVEGVNPDIMGSYRDSSSAGNSPRLQHRVPAFNSNYGQEKSNQNVDSGHKPKVRVIPIQVEGVDVPLKRNRTFSGPAGTVEEVDARQPTVFKSHVQNEIPNLFNTNEAVKRPNRTKVCNIPVEIEPRAEKVSEIPKFEKKIEVKKVPSTTPKPDIVEPIPPETNGCVPSKVEDKPSEPDLNIPLQQIEAVLNKLKTYSEEVKKFCGTPKDKQYRYLDEMLTRCMLDLDDVETFGMDNIRQSRKAAIRQVQACIDLLDTKINAQTSLPSNDVTMTDAESNKLEVNSEPVIKEVIEAKLSETIAEEGSVVVVEESLEPIIEEIKDSSISPNVELCDMTEITVQEVNSNSIEEIKNPMNVDPSDESVPLVQELDEVTTDLNSCGDVEMAEKPALDNSPATIKNLNDDMEISVSPLVVEPPDTLDLKQTCDSSTLAHCVMEPDSYINCPSKSNEQFSVEEMDNDSVNGDIVEQFNIAELTDNCINNEIIEQYSVEELANDSVNNIKSTIEELPTVIES